MPSPVPVNGHRGPIIPIGGAEDHLGDTEVLRGFVERAGGRGARVAVVPTASRLRTTGGRYVEVFGRLGAAAVDVVDVRTRKQAQDPRHVAVLEQATGIFLTGGDQVRLSTILGGTPVAPLIRRRNAAGVPVGGTSAGAAFLSEHMTAGGAESATPHAGQVTLAPGQGLTNRVIVDQHFRQRDRLGRLLAALAYNPFCIGVGLDEDTAAVIGPDNVLEVAGTGAITVVDASGIDHSSMPTARAGDPVELIGIRLHVLTRTARYDLESRRAWPAQRR